MNRRKTLLKKRRKKADKARDTASALKSRFDEIAANVKSAAKKLFGTDDNVFDDYNSNINALKKEYDDTLALLKTANEKLNLYQKLDKEIQKFRKNKNLFQMKYQSSIPKRQVMKLLFRKIQSV